MSPPPEIGRAGQSLTTVRAPPPTIGEVGLRQCVQEEKCGLEVFDLVTLEKRHGQHGVPLQDDLLVSARLNALAAGRSKRRQRRLQIEWRYKRLIGGQLGDGCSLKEHGAVELPAPHYLAQQVEAVSGRESLDELLAGPRGVSPFVAVA